MRRLAFLLLAPALLLAAPDDEIPGERARPGKEKPKKEVTCTGEIGFAGWSRLSGWIPVFLRLQNTTDDDLSLVVSTSVPYGEGGAGAAFSRSLDLPSGGKKALTLYVRPIQYLDGLDLQCRSARSGLAVCAARLETKPCVQPGRTLLVCTGSSALGGLRARSPRDAAAEVDDLPDRPEGYDGVDWAVLRGSAWASDPVRLEALTAWVESGGRIAVAGAEALRALAASPLGRRLKVSLGEPERLEDFSALSRLAADDLASPDGGAVLVEKVRFPGAEARAGVVLERGLGSGKVLLFAVDPEAFRKQPGYWGLWRNALELPAYSKEDEDDPVRDPPPFWTAAALGSGLFHKERIRLDWIWGFLGVYLLVVAPLDYWLVKRMWKIRTFGLATLAFWALSASFVCYRLGTSGKFSRTIVSRAGVIDAFPAANRIAGRTIASFYPNTNGVYDLSAPAGKGSAWVVVDPKDIFRSGLLTRETLQWEEDGPSLAAKGVPIYIGIQKLLESRWTADLASIGISVTRLADGRWRIENRSKATLRGQAGTVPAGGSLDLEMFQGALAGEGKTSAQQVIHLWNAAQDLSGSPMGFGPQGSLSCMEFWMEGGDLPLGIEGVRVRDADEGILLRLHLD